MRWREDFGPTFMDFHILKFLPNRVRELQKCSRWGLVYFWIFSLVSTIESFFVVNYFAYFSGQMLACYPSLEFQVSGWEPCCQLIWLLTCFPFSWSNWLLTCFQLFWLVVDMLSVDLIGCWHAFLSVDIIGCWHAFSCSDWLLTCCQLIWLVVDTLSVQLI